MMASTLQDQEAGMMLMSRILTDIKSLVRYRAGETDDIIVLHSTLIAVLQDQAAD